MGGWSAIAGRPLVLLVFALLLVSIAGLPPFPGFWAKWELVMQLSGAKLYASVGVILVGSLMEAAYMFGWFKQATRAIPAERGVDLDFIRFLPPAACALVLAVAGYFAASIAGVASVWLFAPLCIGGLLYALDWLPGRVKCTLMLATVLVVSAWMIADIGGISRLFAILLLAGGLVVASGALYRGDARPGYYPLMAVLLLSIAGLLRATTSLEFFFCWELITLSSYFMIAQGRNAHPHALPFLLFSLVAAYCLLAGFAFAKTANGTDLLAAFRTGGPDAANAFTLLALGFLIKAGAIGAHVWIPGAYAESDDDLSALLSSVVSKVAVFGLFLVTYLAIRSEAGIELAHLMGWIGMLTTVAGAIMALQQDELKRLLAYSSMSQIGYIITAIALMSHLGWVTALYLVANHLMVKGILFLAVAGIILRTGTQLVDQHGDLARHMPLSFAAVAVALISMSGLPPLAGFGGKWLLLSAMMDKGWYGLVALGVIATFIGFLYMFRLAYGVFLGPRKVEHEAVEEAPAALLLPQFVLVAAILLLSFFPKLVMDPVSAAIDPYFASTLVWEGMSLEMVYGYWNPLPVMGVTVAATAILFGLLWLFYRSQRDRSARLDVGLFYAYCKAVFAPLVVPLANGFWDGVSAIAMRAARSMRKLYTGNGQTYALHVLHYVAVLYLVTTFGVALLAGG